MLGNASFGFKAFEIIETVLYHQLGELTEPQFEHRFW